MAVEEYYTQPLRDKGLPETKIKTPSAIFDKLVAGMEKAGLVPVCESSVNPDKKSLSYI